MSPKVLMYSLEKYRLPAPPSSSKINSVCLPAFSASRLLKGTWLQVAATEATEVAGVARALKPFGVHTAGTFNGFLA